MKIPLWVEVARCGLLLFASVVLPSTGHRVHASDGFADDQLPRERGAANAASYDALILGGRVVDGTGNAWFHGDVAVRGDRIARITPAGMLQHAAAKERIDA